MKLKSLYSELGYDDFLKTNSEIASFYPDYKDIEKIGADKIYFSGENPAVLFVNVISFSDSELTRISSIQKKAWNYRKVLLLFAISDTEIRIYNCHEKPSYIGDKQIISDELEKLQIFKYNDNSDDEVLDILLNVFSRIGVDCGLLWSVDYGIHKKINTQKRLDKYLVKSLLNTATELEYSGIKDKSIIHALLMRSLFILFLEDKGAAAEAGLYKKIKYGAESYFDILEDQDATYLLFDEVQEHFNGNIFPVLPDERKIVNQEHLLLIKKCFIDGDLSSQPKLFNKWRLFDFEIIHIELLSEIYENFLGELKQERGQFYTPHNLVELILKEKLPTNSNRFNIKVLDPACGSGIFLVESYKRLVKRWKNSNPNKKIDFKDLSELLIDNIYGIEIDQTAIKVAAFSLYLALVDELDPKTLWIKTDYQLPYLIYDPEDEVNNNNKLGKNLWRMDTIGEVDAEKFIKADLLVGNPPFGTKNLTSTIIDYCKQYSFAEEMVLPFIHKAVTFCPRGQIALVFNTKILTNTEKPFENFRNWLFNDNSVEKLYNLSIFRNVPMNYGGQLFSSTITPVSIIYFQKPKIGSLHIEYWSPKTYIKSYLFDGIIIDNSDINYLPLKECQKPDSKIWKIAMWGSIWDFKLIEKISSHFISVGSYLKSNPKSWVFGRGLHPDYKKEFFIPEKILPIGNVKQYFTDDSSFEPNDKKFRPIKKGLFGRPFLTVKETLLDNKICSSYISSNQFTLYSTHNFSCTNQDELLALNVFLNSDFVHYFLFLTASEWGIKTPRILFNEFLSIPSLFDKKKLVKELSNLSKEIIEIEKNVFFKNEKAELIALKRNRVDAIIQAGFKLTKKDTILISDLLKRYELYIKGHKSESLCRTSLDENIKYSETLITEMNLFLSSSNSFSTATIFDMKINDPLNMVVLNFENSKKEIEVKSFKSLRSKLKEIDKYLLQQKAGQSIFVQKQIRHYDTNKIYLIKPNQKRFWTRSQALEDATSIIEEILNMEGTK